MDLSAFFSRHKEAVLVAAAGIGVIIFLIVRGNSSSTTTSSPTTQENSSTTDNLHKEPSDSTTQSPSSPEITVNDMIAPGATTAATPTSKKKGAGPGDSVPYEGETLIAFPGDQNDFEGLN